MFKFIYANYYMKAELNKPTPYTIAKEKYWLYERNLKTFEITKTLVERDTGTDWLGANNQKYWYERFIEPPKKIPVWKKLFTGNFWAQFWPQLIAGAIVSGVILWLTIRLAES
jgi:hypothetical protein